MVIFKHLRLEARNTGKKIVIVSLLLFFLRFLFFIFSSTYAAPGFPPTPYGFTAPAATGYATAFQQAASGPRQVRFFILSDNSVFAFLFLQEASSVGFAYASRPEGGYIGGAPPIYASPLTAAAASGVAASGNGIFGWGRQQPQGTKRLE